MSDVAGDGWPDFAAGQDFAPATPAPANSLEPSLGETMLVISRGNVLVIDPPYGRRIIIEHSRDALGDRMTAADIRPDGGDEAGWNPKSLREHLCGIQTVTDGACNDAVQAAINVLDGHRPVGPDGTHGDRHTGTCGCEDAANGSQS